MFFYVFAGFSLFCGGVYLVRPRIFYRTVINISIVIIKNFIWLKQIKNNLFGEKTKLIHDEEVIIDNYNIQAFTYKVNDTDKNYTHNYKLKYILDNNNIDVKHHIQNKLQELNNFEILNNKMNTILHCNFYWDNDPETILELTEDLRHFVLHFDCDETTLYKFIKYIIKKYNLNVDLEDHDTCGIFLIKNDDFFSEVKVTINDSKYMTFKEVINDN